MKFFCSISLNRNCCPPDVYAKIVQLKPQGAGSVSFHLEAKPGDESAAELVERILAMCKEHGLKESRGETVGSYVYSVDRIYERADLEAAELLLLVGGRAFLNDVRRDESGRLVLPATKAKASLKLAAVFPSPWIVVSQGVRQILVARNLAGLEFGEVVVTGRSIHAANTPFWELRSSIVMPKCLNCVCSQSNNGPVYTIDDGSYRRGEIHYRQSDLQSLGTFDIARTLEPLGRPDSMLIISQRFHRVCLENEISLEVWPARIDPD